MRGSNTWPTRKTLMARNLYSKYISPFISLKCRIGAGRMGLLSFNFLMQFRTLSAVGLTSLASLFNKAKRAISDIKHNFKGCRSVTQFAKITMSSLSNSQSDGGVSSCNSNPGLERFFPNFIRNLTSFSRVACLVASHTTFRTSLEFKLVRKTLYFANHSACFFA